MHYQKKQHSTWGLVKLFIMALLFLLANMLLSQSVRADVYSMQAERWQRAKIRNEWSVAVDKAIWQFKRDEARYQNVTNMRNPGVPAIIIFVLHGRESTWSFARHLHEGSLLTSRTRYIPKGRPRTPNPPFTWERSAEDALYLLKDMETKNWRDIPNMLQEIEKFNGTGYQRFHPDVPSPYLWSGTTVYSRGKYVEDGRFSGVATDKQLGCATILLRYMEGR